MSSLVLTPELTTEITLQLTPDLIHFIKWPIVVLSSECNS